MEGSWLILAVGGLFAGVLSGILGIGGGFIIVSLMVALKYKTIEAIATSSFVIIMNSSAGSYYNWRMGYLNLRRVIYIAIPAIIFAFLGAYVTDRLQDYDHVLLTILASFMLVNIGLIRLKKSLAAKSKSSTKADNPILARIFTGGIAGFLSGLLGIGGGAIMVPLQMLLLNEDIKVAVRTSLGVIVTATVSSCVFHISRGNVLFIPGLLLGISGMVGSQLGTRTLPKLPSSLVSKIFIFFLAIMAILNYWKAWESYHLV